MLISEPAAESEFLAIMHKKKNNPQKALVQVLAELLVSRETETDLGGTDANGLRWCRCPTVGVGRAQRAWNKRQGLEMYQSCSAWERRDPLLTQSIAVSGEEERKHLTLKGTLPSRPQHSGQLLTHLASSPPWPEEAWKSMGRRC